VGIVLVVIISFLRYDLGTSLARRAFGRDSIDWSKARVAVRSPRILSRWRVCRRLPYLLECSYGLYFFEDDWSIAAHTAIELPRQRKPRRLCLRGFFQFHGAARTGRWAGRLFQPQNLPRGSLAPEALDTARAALKLGDHAFVAASYGSVSDVLVSCVRTAIAAPEGKQLVVADYASIETVMLAWAAATCSEPGA